MPPRLARAVAASGALCMAAAPVRADDFAISPGIHFVLWFGGDRVMPGIGLDLRGTWIAFSRDSPCVDRTSGGVGLFGQATWMFGSARYALGLHAGSEYGNDPIFPSWDVELGWTYRTAASEFAPGHGLHLGIMGTFELIDAAARLALTFLDDGLVGEGSLGTGIRFPGPFHWGDYDVCSIGRPLRVGGRVVRPDVTQARPCAERHRLDDATRRALAAAWLDDARAEAASVPAFEILASDLRALDAPARLIRGAYDAARDEIRHTGMCAELASRLAGSHRMPRRLAPCRPERPSFARLAIESWRDGCLGEGAAARRAARGAEHATDDLTRATQRRIALDEARHAELAWDVLAFALHAAPETRDVLAAELAEPAAAPQATLGPDRECRAWRAHGRLDAADLDDTWYANHAAALRRARRLLDGASAAQPTSPGS